MLLNFFWFTGRILGTLQKYVSENLATEWNTGQHLMSPMSWLKRDIWLVHIPLFAVQHPLVSASAEIHLWNHMLLLITSYYHMELRFKYIRKNIRYVDAYYVKSWILVLYQSATLMLCIIAWSSMKFKLALMIYIVLNEYQVYVYSDSGALHKIDVCMLNS